MTVRIGLPETHEEQILFWHEVQILSVFASSVEVMLVGRFRIDPPEILVLQRRVKDSPFSS